MYICRYMNLKLIFNSTEQRHGYFSVFVFFFLICNFIHWLSFEFNFSQHTGYYEKQTITMKFYARIN